MSTQDGPSVQFLVVAATAALLAPVTLDATGDHDAPDWLAEDGAGVVRLRLAHAEAARPDGGTLVVDPNRKVPRGDATP